MTTTKKKKIQGLEKPNPGLGGGSTSTSTSIPPPGPPDRISELPKEILHHILGFLKMDELLIRTSLVSTKWRNLWKSVSTLKFTLCPPGSRISRIDSGSVDSDGFVDHVLRLRDSEASKIQIFNYYWACSLRGYDYLERLHNIIVSAAVNQGAQEIQIMGRYSGENGNMIHFNPSIFTSVLLRKFTFKVFNSDFLIQFPRSMCCATQLTHLSLTGIILPEGDDSNAELHLVCPLLETFHMNYCYSEHLKVLDIFAPKLITLSIYNVGMTYEDFDGLGGCRIEIRTPNLTSLVYSGHVYGDCFMENLHCIAYASLNFTKEIGMVEETTSFAIKLLKGLTSAKSLTLRGFEFVEVEGDEHLMLPQCRLSHLKHVHFERLRGHENEIEFVKFLLKSSVVLEEIIIHTTADSPKQSIEENLKQFIEEEPSFRSIKLCVLQEEF